MSTIHAIDGTASRPLRYRTRCGLSAYRGEGERVYEPRHIERITCPMCRKIILEAFAEAAASGRRTL